MAKPSMKPVPQKAEPVRIPHVAWRDGRPRFSPGPSLRALGFKPMDLKHPDGRWMSRGEALDWSQAMSEEVAVARARARKKVADKRPAGAAIRRPVNLYTLRGLFDDWFRSPRFPQPKPRGDVIVEPPKGMRVLAPATVRFYRQMAGVIEAHDAELYDSAVIALDRAIVYGLYEQLVAARGLHTATAVVRTLSAALSWGIRRGKVKMDVNPAMRAGMQTPAPRIRIGSREEIAALLEAADAVGLSEIGDMIVLGIWTGQRQGDRLDLVDQGLWRGRRIFKQSKTGEIVAILEAPELERRLSAAKARRPERAAGERHIVLDESTWKPMSGDRYRKLYGKVRDVAAAGLFVTPDGDPVAVGGKGGLTIAAATKRAAAGSLVMKVKPCPSVADLRDQDLRDTSVTWMALAGATIPEIISVTGHTAESAHQILKHYLARQPELADAALNKLIGWYEQAEE